MPAPRAAAGGRPVEGAVLYNNINNNINNNNVNNNDITNSNNNITNNTTSVEGAVLPRGVEEPLARVEGLEEADVARLFGEQYIIMLILTYTNDNQNFR